jgi:hemerythrin superfamily protein
MWHKFLKTHAENEESSLFPKTEELLEEKGIWEETHKEHGMS